MAPKLLQAAAIALHASSLICPTTPTCPQDDSCTHVSNGASLQISCGTDFYGGDLQLAQTSTLVGCMKACATTSGCVGASYNGRNCYLKSTLNAAQTNDNIIGVAVISREPTIPGPIETPSACPASYACPENDGCRLQSEDFRIFALLCETDFYGGDFFNMYAADLDVCTKACVDNPRCVAASFTGGQGAGYCYLKDRNNGASTNDNVDAVAIDTRVVPSPSTTPSDVPTTFSITSATETISVVTSSYSSSVESISTSSSTPSSAPTPTPTTTSILPPSTSTSMPTPTQVLLNTGFENGTGNVPAQWNLNADFALSTNIGRLSADARSGAYSFQAATPYFLPTWEMSLSQVVTVVPGKAYDVAVWSRSNPLSVTCSVHIAYNNIILGEDSFYPTIGYTENVRRVTSDMTASGSGTVMIVITCTNSSPYARIFLDEITMTQVQP